LILGSVRQHQLTEAAESVNTRLREEISQRQQAEEALRESEERFRALFDSAPMAVIACDRHAVIQHYNARALELWGRTPVRGVERQCDSLQMWLPDGTPLSPDESPMMEVLRTGRPLLDMEVLLGRPDGSRVPVLVSFAALKTGKGETTGAITSFVDLRERKKLEERSFRSQRMESIGRIAGGIAHDLNNSLGPILMSLELLRMKLPDPDSQELLSILEGSAERGADMVRQVLSFARGVEGRRVEVNVVDLIREIEKIVNETFLRHIQIRTHIAPGLWTVIGDSTQMHQVLLNLCLNARDAMPQGGTLVLSAENRLIDSAEEALGDNPQARPGPFVLLSVEDSGSGISPAAMETIFDPFFTTKQFGKGSGLGLSTSLAIVKSHGGFLQVATELGKGTTFQVFIPAQHATMPPSAPPTALETPRGRGELILVVDDERPMREMTQRTLESFGYRVVLACDGAEAAAIYALRRAEIAGVITDMTMPVMDGPALIRMLRNMNPTLPIIGVSGLASTNYAAQLATLGLEHILSKPFRTAELLKMVKHVLEETAAEEGAGGQKMAP
jgi:PAS domain S-box-containing protein